MHPGHEEARKGLLETKQSQKSLLFVFCSDVLSEASGRGRGPLSAPSPQLVAIEPVASPPKNETVT